MIKNGIQLAEKGYLPDFILKKAIKRILMRRLKEISNERSIKTDAKLDFFEKLKNSPIAISTKDANEQHYEVPASFFKFSFSSAKQSLENFNCLFDLPFPFQYTSS